MNSDQKVGKALVIGGGMAGLLAARMLADAYEEVVIVERDDLPQGPGNRPGTPQAYHPHRLLPRGKMILEELFPGYTDDLLARGAFLREGKIVQLRNPYGSIEVPEERDAGSSRALLEWVFRQRVQKLRNVRFFCQQEVIGLQHTHDDSGMTRITGVHIQERGQMGRQTTLDTDIVVDASGNSSKLIRWLDDLGYDLPEAERLKVFLGYSTRHYKMPPHLANQWSVILIEGDPAKAIGTGVLSQIEDNIAEVTLYYAGGEYYPTTDGNDYEQEASKLLSPAIAEVLRGLEPISEPRGYRVPECVRNHFELMPRWPAGLLVLGDALCNFDPIFGQGMTVAAIEAEILATCLLEQRSNPQPDFERGVLQRMQDAIEPAWWLSAVADLRWPGVEYIGPQPLKGVAFAQKYFDLYLHQVFGQHNMELFEKYYMMTSLLISPREVINADRVSAVLAAEPSAAGKQLWDEFLRGEDQPLEEVLEQLIPSFAHVAMPFPTLLATG